MKKQQKSILSAVDFPVSRTVLPANDVGPVTQDGSGPSSLESSVPSVLGMFSSKMCRDCGTPACVMCWPMLPPSGSMRNGMCLARPKSVRPIGGNASSYWPTPVASTYDSNQGGQEGRVGKIRYSLRAMAKMGMWPTPTATLGSHAGLITPAKGREGGTLVEATPTARDWKDGACANSTAPTNYLLGRQAPRTNVDGKGTSKDGMVLNPRFVEAMQGFPPGWTDCDFSGIRVSRKRRPSLSSP